MPAQSKKYLGMEDKLSSNSQVDNDIQRCIASSNNKNLHTESHLSTKIVLSTIIIPKFLISKT